MSTTQEQLQKMTQDIADEVASRDGVGNTPVVADAVINEDGVVLLTANFTYQDIPIKESAGFSPEEQDWEEYEGARKIVDYWLSELAPF